MKNFEYFVTRVFDGSDNLESTYLAIQELADDGNIDKIIECFAMAAEAYKDQHIDYLGEKLRDLVVEHQILQANKTIYDEEAFS